MTVMISHNGETPERNQTNREETREEQEVHKDIHNQQERHSGL